MLIKPPLRGALLEFYQFIGRATDQCHSGTDDPVAGRQ